MNDFQRCVFIIFGIFLAFIAIATTNVPTFGASVLCWMVAALAPYRHSR